MLELLVDAVCGKAFELERDMPCCATFEVWACPLKEDERESRDEKKDLRCGYPSAR